MRFVAFPGGLALAAQLAFAAPAVADAERGAAVYERCLACHALSYHRVGPKHCGLLGRPAGTVEGFDFSPAMGDSGIVWTRETLDRFLADPLAMVPGTIMTYDGVKDAEDRADLIDYLAAANEDPALCP